MVHLRPLPPDLPYDVEADPRGAGQVGRLRPGGGGAVRADPAGVGVAVAAVSPCDYPGSQCLQATQSQELQTVHHRDPSLLPPTCHHRHGLPWTGLLRVPL